MSDSSSTQEKPILVALSGGVDSSVAAALLLEQGHAIEAAYMKNWINEDDIFGDCPWQEDIEAARGAAEKLGIPFQVVNLIEDYKSRIVEYLLDGYQQGITPNPDVLCNREMKFGVFLDWALEHGYAGVATGHYARKITKPGGRAGIALSADDRKDQTYFLALMKQEQVQKAWFPLADLPKTEVRAKARELDLPNAHKKDSQGICFIGNIRMKDFLRHYVPDRPGPIVNREGRELGTHQGLHLFTIGQRKGLGIPSNKDFEHYVVVEKNWPDNQLIVDFDKPSSPGLFTDSVTLRDLSWIDQPVTQKVTLLARPRYLDPSQEITFIPLENNRARITFESPQRALAAGQILAIYRGDELLGGGVYE
ncbi:MAG: tRNA 2-thiouridine(34) synthase MnmA [Opitutales bacterium]|nr:tRNA 2-thiouridine(34) synthase MnmA [Opitutales bacterium]MCH8541644.1 tRNA 2-thiouridine(34) synthase MnmA [Opitutales bacterium]